MARPRRPGGGRMPRFGLGRPATPRHRTSSCAAADRGPAPARRDRRRPWPTASCEAGTGDRRPSTDRRAGRRSPPPRLRSRAGLPRRTGGGCNRRSSCGSFGGSQHRARLRQIDRWARPSAACAPAPGIFRPSLQRTCRELGDRESGDPRASAVASAVDRPRLEGTRRRAADLSRRSSPSGARRIGLRRARKGAPAGRNRGDRFRVARDRGQARAQRLDVLDVLDRDAAVAIRHALVVRKLADHLGRADQAGAAHEHLARNDGGVKRDREILLEAAYGEAGAQELGHAPVRQERNLQDAVGEAELLGPRAKSAFERRPAVRHAPPVRPRSRPA